MPDTTNKADPVAEYKAREKRINDALNMKQPDRILVMASFGYFPADYAGVTRQELHENPEKHLAALKKAALEFQPDLASGVMGGAIPSKMLGDRMTRWTGYGLGEQGSFQFIEKEFMKADDYDALLNDPSDKVSGINYATFRLHRGSDGIISSRNVMEIEGCDTGLIKTWTDAT